MGVRGSPDTHPRRRRAAAAEGRRRAVAFSRSQRAWDLGDGGNARRRSRCVPHARFGGGVTWRQRRPARWMVDVVTASRRCVLHAHACVHGADTARCLRFGTRTEPGPFAVILPARRVPSRSPSSLDVLDPRGRGWWQAFRHRWTCSCLTAALSQRTAHVNGGSRCFVS